MGLIIKPVHLKNLHMVPIIKPANMQPASHLMVLKTLLILKVHLESLYMVLKVTPKLH